MKTIALLSDFGTRDSYLASIKGVVLSIAPDTEIVDISHDIKQFDVRHGAFVLASSAPYFPKDTIFIGIVDPGVGTERRPIVIETEKGFLVGPDNGLLLPAAEKLGMTRVFQIKNTKLMRKKVSSTFHGRDVFAPIAGWLANGIGIEDVGPEIDVASLVKIEKTHPTITENSLKGEIFYIDHFGNAATNIPTNTTKKAGISENDMLAVRVGERIRLEIPFCSTYGDVDVGKALCVVGSHGFLELSINQGNISTVYGVNRGMPVEIKKID